MLELFIKYLPSNDYMLHLLLTFNQNLHQKINKKWKVKKKKGLLNTIYAKDRKSSLEKRKNKITVGANKR